MIFLQNRVVDVTDIGFCRKVRRQGVLWRCVDGPISLSKPTTVGGTSMVAWMFPRSSACGNWRENAGLKKIVAEQVLDIRMLKAA